jgi:uncharacterized Fe-S cluster-containing radical SAM superfamily protein
VLLDLVLEMCSNEKFRLLVTQDAVLERDLFVINELRNRNIPTVMVPSGGYTNESHVLIQSLKYPHEID